MPRTKPRPLPIIDMSPSLDSGRSHHPEATNRNLDSERAEMVNRSHITGLRKFSSDLSNEVKALEKVLVPLTFDVASS